MALNGVATVVYGVDDVARCAAFYADFGLTPTLQTAAETAFKLPEGSIVRLLHADDASLPDRFSEGPGIRETVWGVESPDELDRLESDLATDRIVMRDSDGTVHFRDDQGTPMGLRVFERQAPPASSERVNSPGRVDRWNQHRSWYESAKPSLIHHVVYGVPDIERGMAFYVNRLGFRITDVARERGIFARCAGRNDHHNLFLMKADKARFAHISFGVENIDELMAGANHMSRNGWKSPMGLGRHRISSTIFYYLVGPCGGETEYSADMDYLDDNWQPRIWEPKFGNVYWVATLPPTLQEKPVVDVQLLDPS